MKATARKSALWLITCGVSMAVASGWWAAPAVAQRGATRPRVQFPQGPVRQVIRKNCTACHGIDDYAFFAMDKAGWSKLISEKHKSGVANLSEVDRDLLLGWLAERFGPATKPFPRTYIPPEIATFFSDPEAFRLMNRACTRCHAIDKVQGARKAADDWRVTLVDMRERGAQLSDEELERLV